MADLIDRQEAIKALCKAGCDSGHCGVSCPDVMAIEHLPSAVVRCKDCKHRIEHKHYGDLGESAYTCEGNMGGWILPDGFCSYGERKDA